MKNIFNAILISLAFVACGNYRSASECNSKKRNLQISACEGGTGVTITNDHNILYKHCFIDVSDVGQSEALDINGDDKADFLCTLRMEDYFILTAFVSKEDGYTTFQWKEVMDAQIYSSSALENNRYIKNFILKDTDGDGIKEILINVIVKKRKIFSIPNFSDTLSINKFRLKMER